METCNGLEDASIETPSNDIIFDEQNKSHVCGKCRKIFRSSRSLQRHSKSHQHQAIVCPHCGKNFSSKSSLNTHIITHREQKPFECLTCGHGFAQKVQLEIHMLIHTGEKPHLCNVCGKKYRQKTDLVRHQRVHSDERPYDCDMCDKKFRMKSVLDAHKRIHTGEKPFECSVCNEKFRIKRTLSRHMLVHSSLRQHVCDTCGKAFKRKEHLNVHVRTHINKTSKTNNAGLSKFDVVSCDALFTAEATQDAHRSTGVDPSPYVTHAANAAVKGNRNQTVSSVVETSNQLRNQTGVGLHFETTATENSFCHASTNPCPPVDSYIIIQHHADFTKPQKNDVDGKLFASVNPIIFGNASYGGTMTVSAEEQFQQTVETTHFVFESETAASEPESGKAESLQLVTSLSGSHTVDTMQTMHAEQTVSFLALTSSSASAATAASEVTSCSTSHDDGNFPPTDATSSLANISDAMSSLKSKKKQENSDENIKLGGPAITCSFVPVLPENTMESKKTEESATQLKTVLKSEQPLVCDCGRSFKRLGSYKNHLKTHKHTSSFNEQDLTIENTTKGDHNTRSSLDVHHYTNGSSAVGTKNFTMCNVPNIEVPSSEKLDDQEGICSLKNDAADNDKTGSSSSKRKSHKCKFCEKEFKTRNGLLYHERSVHLGTATALCPHCGKELSCRASLFSHLLIHEGKKEYRCTICNRLFRQKGHLQKHMLHHTGEKPHTCSVCARSFRQAIDLQRHMRTHTGEKPFKCPSCPKAFAIEHSLNAHVRIHNGEKPFSCNVCGLKFRVKVTRDRHLLIHSDFRPFQCNTCKQAFRRKDHVTQHWHNKSNDCSKDAGFTKLDANSAGPSSQQQWFSGNKTTWDRG